MAGLLGLPSAQARNDLDADTQRLLVEAVEAAVALDFYYSRCRGDVSGRRVNNLNKLIVGKLRLTVLSIQDDLFPEKSYRRVQQRLQEDFVASLQAAGGCSGAKESDLPERLSRRYEESLAAIRKLP